MAVLLLGGAARAEGAAALPKFSILYEPVTASRVSPLKMFYSFYSVPAADYLNRNVDFGAGQLSSIAYVSPSFSDISRGLDFTLLF